MIPSMVVTIASAAFETTSACPVPNGAGFLKMVLGAGPMVKAIMALLLGMSVLCWAVIAVKARVLWRAVAESERFIDLFTDRKGFDTLFADSETMVDSHLAYIFRKGYTELVRVREWLEGKELSIERPQTELILENVDRAIQGGVIKRRKRFERLLPILATTGSTAPFIGLFGTVWGIMGSFQDIGMKGSANLAVVAPGISEALVATAMGLAAAIPAVVAYNHFSNKIRSLEDDMLHFTSDLLNTLRTDPMGMSGHYGHTTAVQDAGRSRAG